MIFSVQVQSNQERPTLERTQTQTQPTVGLTNPVTANGAEALQESNVDRNDGKIRKEDTPGLGARPKLDWRGMADRQATESYIAIKSDKDVDCANTQKFKPEITLRDQKQETTQSAPDHHLGKRREYGLTRSRSASQRKLI